MNKRELIAKVNNLDGLTTDEKSALIELINTKKRYGLVWEDKPEDVEKELISKLPVLVEVKDKAILAESEMVFVDNSLEDESKDSLFPITDPQSPTTNDIAPNHLLIEGDNLHALTVLNYTHEGKIDVIYIDPPYNTGNKDFKYNDRYVDKEDSYRHSKWLSFMSKRLTLARSLLKDTGVIFISIDDNEVAQLKLLCDEIFGEPYLRNIINTRRQDKNLSNQFLDKGLQSLAIGCEYILLYSKTSNVILNPIFRDANDERKENGYWKGFWNAANRPTMRYLLFDFKPEDGQWKWKESVAKEAVENYLEYLNIIKDNNLSLEEYWAETGKSKKFIRKNPTAYKGKNKGIEHWIPPSEGILRTSNWSDILTTQTFSDVQFNFSSPKNIKLIQEIIKFSCNKKNVKILDFFAGSGTTLHATMQLNAEDGGNRQCILVTNNENKIAEEVCYERNKRVIQGYTKPNGEKVPGLTNNNFRYYKTDFVPREKSPSNRKKLTELATDMLCIKDDCYNSIMNDELRITKGNIKLFENDLIYMMIILDEDFIDQAVEIIKNLEKKVKVYIFSPSQYPFTDDFEEVLDKVDLCALPEAIYQAYKSILPKKKVLLNNKETSEVLNED